MRENRGTLDKAQTVLRSFRSRNQKVISLLSSIKNESIKQLSRMEYDDKNGILE